MDRIEPMPGPSLPIARRLQKLIDQCLIRGLTRVIQKVSGLLWARWQADQIEIESANPLSGGGQRGTFKLLLLELRIDEGIDWIDSTRSGICIGWYIYRDQRLERPPIVRIAQFGHCDSVVKGTLLDPFPQGLDLGICQFLIGHFQLGISVLDGPDQETFLGFKRDDGRPARTSCHPSTFPVECKSAFHLPRRMRMARIAMLLEHRQDLFIEELFALVLRSFL